MYSRICKVLLDFFSFSYSLVQLFLLSLYCLLLPIIPNCIKYFLIHQVLLIIAAITPFSAIAQFSFFFFIVSVNYQNLQILSLQYIYQVGFFYQLPISGPSISVVIISATLPSTSISTPYQLSASPIIYLHEVIWYHVLVSSLLSPFGISHFYHLQVSASRIKHSSKLFLSATLCNN